MNEIKIKIDFKVTQNNYFGRVFCDFKKYQEDIICCISILDYCISGGSHAFFKILSIFILLASFTK